MFLIDGVKVAIFLHLTKEFSNYFYHKTLISNYLTFEQ